MSVIECAQCAWRGNCNLKFQQQSSELHCREFSRDAALDVEKEKPEEDEAKKREK